MNRNLFHRQHILPFETASQMSFWRVAGGLCRSQPEYTPMDPKFIQAVVAPGFLLMGLSHLVQPQLSVRFFEVVRQTGATGFIIPLYTLPLGLVLIAGHNLWVWDWPLVLTVSGWGMVFKSA